MAGSMQTGAYALVMDRKDHVATAIKDIAAGETIPYAVSGHTASITAMEPIPFGHKIAIVDIREGEDVRKYGEVIGRATAEIAKGKHVHVQNVEGIRGRGDIAAKGAAAK